MFPFFYNFITDFVYECDVCILTLGFMKTLFTVRATQDKISLINI